jgi:hypothetical protein
VFRHGRNGAPWPCAIIAVLFGFSFWGPYVHALGDASNLAALYAFVVDVLAQHYGSRVSGIKPWLAAVAALLSVLAFCYYGTCKQTAPVLKLECLSAAWLVAVIAWLQFSIPLLIWPVNDPGNAVVPDLSSRILAPSLRRNRKAENSGTARALNRGRWRFRDIKARVQIGSRCQAVLDLGGAK